MPNLDDERFEVYLKQFRPVVPEPLPTVELGHRTRRTFVLWAWAVPAAAILVIGAALTLHIRTNDRTHRAPVTETAGNVGNSERLQDSQLLTMRSARALMAKAQSFKSMVDDMAFRSQTVPLPKGKRSAVAVLSQEKIKL